MPTKLIKILQRESGPFTTSNNLCSIDMDPNNVTDLSSSYLNMKVTFKDENGDAPNARVKLGHLENGAEYDTSCFIKHATIRSDSVGLVEQQRFCNVNSQTMKQYEMSTEEERSDRLLNSGIVDVDGQGNANLIIPLSKILGCANSDQMFPDYRFGQSRLELEFENLLPVAYKEDIFLQSASLIDMAGVQGGNDGVNVTELDTIQEFENIETAKLYFVAGREYTLSYSLDAGAQPDKQVIILGVTLNDNGNAVVEFETADGTDIEIPANDTMQDVTLQYELPIEINIADFDNATAAPVNYNTFTVTGVPDDYTFHKNRIYLFGYLEQTLAGLQPTDKYKFGYAKLSSATPVAGQDGHFTLVFAATIITLGAQKGCREGTLFLPGEFGPVNWEITAVDLVLAKPIQPMQVPTFEFHTNLVELVNLPGGVREFRRQVELEQNVDLVTMMNPISCLIGEKQFHSFRNSVNSVDTITKDVIIEPEVNGSIYFDKLMQSLDMLKKVQPYTGLLETAIVPERIMPEQAILPNNVVEFRLQKAEGAVTDASILYFFKRLTKAM